MASSLKMIFFEKLGSMAVSATNVDQQDAIYEHTGYGRDGNQDHLHKFSVELFVKY